MAHPSNCNMQWQNLPAFIAIPPKSWKVRVRVWTTRCKKNPVYKHNAIMTPVHNEIMTPGVSMDESAARARSVAAAESASTGGRRHRARSVEAAGSASTGGSAVVARSAEEAACASTGGRRQRARSVAAAESASTGGRRRLARTVRAFSSLPVKLWEQSWARNLFVTVQWRISGLPGSTLINTQLLSATAQPNTWPGNRWNHALT